MAQPTLIPVAENNLPAEEIETVLSNIPGTNDILGKVNGSQVSKVKCSYT